jgi:hypothetical protein
VLYKLIHTAHVFHFKETGKKEGSLHWSHTKGWHRSLLCSSGLMDAEWNIKARTWSDWRGRGCSSSFQAVWDWRLPVDWSGRLRRPVFWKVLWQPSWAPVLSESFELSGRASASLI